MFLKRTGGTMKRLLFALALAAFATLGANAQDNGNKKDTMVRKAGKEPPTAVNQSKAKPSGGNDSKSSSSSQTKDKKAGGRTKSGQGNP
jgi:hypothetical protein